MPVETTPVDIGSAIDVFAELHAVSGGPGAELGWIRSRCASFVTGFRSSGTPDSVTTRDLATLPYPTKFGLFRAALTPAPFLTITNRMLVIRWTDTNLTPRTLLFEPSDVELGLNTPYFAALADKAPAVARRAAVRAPSDGPRGAAPLGNRS